MNKQQTIQSIMQTHLVTVTEEAKFSDIKAIFRDNPFHHIPVVKGNKVIGMLTETDLIKVTGSQQYQAHNSQVDTIFDHAISMERMMQPNPVVIQKTATINDAIEILLQHRFHALPVVDEASHLVGIITTKDLLRCLVS